MGSVVGVSESCSAIDETNRCLPPLVSCRHLCDSVDQCQVCTDESEPNEVGSSSCRLDRVYLLLSTSMFWPSCQSRASLEQTSTKRTNSTTKHKLKSAQALRSRVDIVI